MKLHHLNAFLAAVDTGSIRAAARRLCLSQSALTKALHELEDELETPLILRSVHGIALTPEGTRLLGRARVIAQQLELAQTELRQMKGADEGTVTMGLSPLVAITVLPRAIEAFRRRYRNVVLRVTGGMAGDILPGVREGRLDFGVMIGVGGQLGEDLSFQPWFSARNVLFVRRGHPLAQARTLRELAGQDWVVTSSGPSGLGSRLMTCFAEADLPRPERVLLCESTEAALAVLRGSDMIGFGPEKLLACAEFQGIEALRPEPPPPDSDFGLITRTDAHLTPVAGAFADILHDLCGRKFGPVRRG